MELPTPYVMTFGVLTTLGMLVILLIGQRILSPGHTVAADLARGNTARALLQVGHLLGLFLVAASVVGNCLAGQSIGRDALWVAVFAAAGLGLLAVTGRLGVSVLLRSRLVAEIEGGNVAAGLAAGAHYVATGIITSRAVAGSDLRGLGLSLVFFVIAQLTLHAFVIGFRALTPYDDAEQIQGGNLAAATSYAGLTIAVALIIGHALEGDFQGWSVSLTGYGKAVLFALALYPVRQLVVQTLILGGGLSLRKGALDVAIVERRNEGSAALEAVAYLSTALLVTRLA